MARHHEGGAPERARVRRWGAGLLLLLGACALAPANAAAQQWIPIRSGLPWASGANGCCGGLPDLEALRGRKLDFRTTFLFNSTWATLASSTSNARALVADGAAAVVAFGMLPSNHRGQHAACANGGFDREIRAVGAGLVRAGTPRAVLRLGWEANRFSPGFPWNVTGDGTDYKRCFRRWVSVLRAVPGERFVIDWNMQDKSAYPAAAIYPGNDVVDIIGINVYDRCPPVRNQAQYNRWINTKHRDGINPRGPNSWVRFARERGKKLSIPEWGIGGPRVVGNCAEPGYDNPMFMRNWHAFLTANAGIIAYEGYFNAHGYKDDSRGSHKLAPRTYNPLSAAVYKELWGLPTP